VRAYWAYERDQHDTSPQACTAARQSRIPRDARGTRASSGASGRGPTVRHEPISGVDPMNKPRNSNIAAPAQRMTPVALDQQARPGGWLSVARAAARAGYLLPSHREALEQGGAARDTGSITQGHGSPPRSPRALAGRDAFSISVNSANPSTFRPRQSGDRSNVSRCMFTQFRISEENLAIFAIKRHR
jgi:hypothetical protein